MYADVCDSPAFAALSPYDVLAYLALLRELKGYNNGDLSLPLSRARECGISHPKTLARSLRALCAVGLVAVTRKGGCTKGGQRQPTLYRLATLKRNALFNALAQDEGGKTPGAGPERAGLLEKLMVLARELPGAVRESFYSRDANGAPGESAAGRVIENSASAVKAALSARTAGQTVIPGMVLGSLLTSAVTS